MQLNHISGMAIDEVHTEQKSIGQFMISLRKLHTQDGVRCRKSGVYPFGCSPLCALLTAILSFLLLGISLSVILVALLVKTTPSTTTVTAGTCFVTHIYFTSDGRESYIESLYRK